MPRANDHTQIEAKGGTDRWSQRLTCKSGALDLDRSVFKLTSASKIAQSLKRSTKQSSPQGWCLSFGAFEADSCSVADATDSILLETSSELPATWLDRLFGCFHRLRQRARRLFELPRPG